MRILLAGASGFLGTRLADRLRDRGHELVRLVRREPAHAEERRWDPAAGALDASVLAGVDAAVNLAGAGIQSRRWTAAYKRTLVESRVTTTATLARALAGSTARVLLNGSGVGFYGETGDTAVDERSPSGTGFTAGLCRQWEAATGPAADAGVRVAFLRTGFPLAVDGGLMRPLYWQFRLFAGGRMGSGRQFVPWISMGDWLGAVERLLDRDDLAGPVDLTGPEPVRNAEFSATLARLLHRPNLVPVPRFALRIAVGELGDESVASQRVLPKVLLDNGFAFTHPTVGDALRSALDAPRRR